MLRQGSPNYEGIPEIITVYMVVDDGTGALLNIFAREESLTAWLDSLDLVTLSFLRVDTWEVNP